MSVYKTYSSYLKEKYGDKVYKIPVNLPTTCPNRDGTVAKGGCIFCGDVGTGYEMQPSDMQIKEQLRLNMEKIKKRYKAKYFIPYLQNYSNTYMPIERFKQILEQIAIEESVGIAVSTRPDCIHRAYLEALLEWSQKYKKQVCIELGLQTVNYRTLKEINR